MPATMPRTSVSFELRPAAGAGTSFRQQFRMLALSRRWLFLTGSLLAVIPLVGTGGGQAYPFGFFAAGGVAVLAGGLWALGVWRGEPPMRRSYHWSLPVSRTAHDLARVAAGAIQLVCACAIVAAAIALFAVADGTFAGLAATPAGGWASFFVAPLIVYLLASPVILWNEYAITRWVIGSLVAGGVLMMLLQGPFIRVLDAVLTPFFFNEAWGLGNVLTIMTVHVLTDALAGTVTPAPAGWWPAVALWLGIGAFASLLAARYRPDDLIRLIRG
jgi:hypothetical protein